MKNNNAVRIGTPAVQTDFERLETPARFTVERGEKTGVITAPGEAWVAETDRVMLTHGKMKIRVWEQAGRK